MNELQPAHTVIVYYLSQKTNITLHFLCSRVWQNKSKRRAEKKRKQKESTPDVLWESLMCYRSCHDMKSIKHHVRNVTMGPVSDQLHRVNHSVYIHWGLDHGYSIVAHTFSFLQRGVLKPTLIRGGGGRSENPPAKKGNFRCAMVHFEAVL